MSPALNPRYIFLMPPARSTIFALSSGRPPAAIAVVRISGPQARLALETLVGRVPEPRHATLARLRDPVSGEMLDEALALWFPSPRSETGEDMAELQVHGGRAVIAAVLGALGRLEGFRPAEAGEFTRRAFENGRLDLTAVEGLADLIGADTEAQRRQAFRQLKGMLGNQVETWRARLLQALALVEAGIDFSDEADVPQDLLRPALDIVRALHTEISAALAQAGRGERLRDGFVVAIAGPPNAGKSTLLNRIAKREAAIVSPYAGTTRDVIEVHLDLEGYPVTLLDTAGMRDTDDPVEQEGVRRARERAAAADLVLWVEDATAGDTPTGGITAAGADALADVARQAPVWIVRNKADLLPGGPSLADVSAKPAPGARPMADPGVGQVRGRSNPASANVGSVRAVLSSDEPAAEAGQRSMLARHSAAWVTGLQPTRTPGAPGPMNEAAAGTGSEDDLRASGPAGGGSAAHLTIASAPGRPGEQSAGGSMAEFAQASESGGTDQSGDGRPVADPRSEGWDSYSAGSATGLPSPSFAASNSNAASILHAGGQAPELPAAPFGTQPRPQAQAPTQLRSQAQSEALHENSAPAQFNEPRFNELKFILSATSESGARELLEALQSHVKQYFSDSSVLLTRERHRFALGQVQASLERAMSLPVSQEELAAEEMRLAAQALGRITGRVDVEDILEVIFRDFCIGK